MNPLVVLVAVLGWGFAFGFTLLWVLGWGGPGLDDPVEGRLVALARARAAGCVSLDGYPCSSCGSGNTVDVFEEVVCVDCGRLTSVPPFRAVKWAGSAS